VGKGWGSKENLEGWEGKELHKPVLGCQSNPETTQPLEVAKQLGSGIGGTPTSLGFKPNQACPSHPAELV